MYDYLQSHVMGLTTIQQGTLVTDNVINTLATINPSFRELFSSQIERAAGSLDLLRFSRYALTRGIMMYFANIRNLMTVSRQEERIAQLHKWINEKAQKAGSMEQYLEFERVQRQDAYKSAEINWTDPRIREYTEEESKANREYLLCRSQSAVFHDIHKVCGRTPQRYDGRVSGTN